MFSSLRSMVISAFLWVKVSSDLPIVSQRPLSVAVASLSLWVALTRQHATVPSGIRCIITSLDTRHERCRELTR